MKKSSPIKPLFIVSNKAEHMGNSIIQFNCDNYNKKLKAVLIDAKNDGEAISSFLSEYKDSPETLRSYTKEIERLLLWCIHVEKINIASIKRDHLLKYQKFLKTPTPKKIWCGTNVARVNKDQSLNENWRPFVKGLSNNTINKIIKILDSFFNYLVQTNYLSGNPLAIDRKRKKRHHTKPKIIDRYLELDEIHAVLQALKEYPATDDTKQFQVTRANYIILLLLYTGLRISEAANHRMGNFIQREDNWFLKVTGKGKKTREIPIPDQLLKALINFRVAIGLSTDCPKFRERTPLIPMQNIKQSISARRVDQILRWAFNLGAEQFAGNEPRKESKLRAASAHWLRHSYVTYLLDSGASLKVAQENAGHSNVGTTMHYRHVAQVDRHTATRGLSLTDESG